jgi:hypothetical protein
LERTLPMGVTSLRLPAGMLNDLRRLSISH